MKNFISHKFSKRIAHYGALSVAIAGVTNASGQIIYTDVNPDEGGTNVNSYIDFDHNGQWDVVISGSANGSFLFAKPRFGNAIIGTSAYGLVEYDYPFALNFNTLISAGNANWKSNYFNQFMNWGSCNFINSQWCGVTDKYLGIRFKISNNIHYGWTRLDVTNGSNWFLKDYAYNSTPNASILAGETGALSIEENELNKIKIVAINKSIGLYNLPASSSYNLYSMTSQEVLKGETNQRDYVIEASTLASGVYIVELGDTNTNAVIRKKVVLQ